MGNLVSTKGDNAEGNELHDNERMRLSNNRVIVYLWTSTYLGGRGTSGHVSVEITRDNKNGALDKNTYISFWPKLELELKKWPENKARPIFSTDGERWSYIKDYTGDRLFQNRRPEYIFCFYTLSTEDIISAFEAFKGNEKNAWTRHGQYVPRVLPGNINCDKLLEVETKQSCVSLACLTLDAGKINHLIGIKGVILATSKGTTGVSSDNSAEVYKNLNFIQPSQNICESVKRQLVSGFIMSPDVLVERLKIAKTKEWEARKNSKIRSMGRMICITIIKDDGSIRSITFSSQSLNESVDQHLQSRESEGNVLDETTYEWLPGDK